MSEFTSADEDAVTAQLGRKPRSVKSVAYRCPCGKPAVTETLPRLDDGTPFPTTFYLTCPKASGAVGTLESQGIMKEMTQRLDDDPELAQQYQAAHEAYIAHRKQLGDVPEIDGVSAGGMPTRVKCLHVHLAHTLAAGPGINPIGDETKAAVGEWWEDGCCIDPGEEEAQ
ncbi:MAG TPA: DUF501 domain-containing protein [Candidatus Stackebrandtia faecavium]|nr:DUF501 domain-containing protein [Candidatus Stackebrandtia faecavium]